MSRGTGSPGAAVAIIPARMGSTRFPGKILADATGQPLVRHVWEVARRARLISRVVIATDDERVRRAVNDFGGESVLTSADHESGTSRLAEAATALGLTGDTIVVNVQGDEPELDPTWIDGAVERLRRSRAPMGTVALPFADDEDVHDPSAVKVVLKRGGSALYFSRAVIPYARDGDHGKDGGARGGGGGGGGGPPVALLKHIGIYAYRRPFLDTYVTLEPTALEQTEMLEQLRVLFYGYEITVAIGAGRSYGGIDTPEQYEAFVLRRRGLADV